MSRRHASTRVGLGQMVIAEVTVVALVVASWGPRWLLVSAVIAAVAIAVATFGRAGGRWWYQAVGAQRRFARRRRRAATGVVIAALDARAPATVVWLRTLAPELTVRAVPVGDRVVAVAADGAGWFAAATVRADVPPGLAENEDNEIEDRASIEPSLLLEMLTPAADRVALSTAAFVRQGSQLWVAVRLSPVDAVGLDLAAADRQRTGVQRAEAVVAAAVVRATRLLGEAGYEAAALDPDGLVAALAAAFGLDAAPQEHWANWSSGRLAHTTYEASGLPPGARLPGAFAVAVSVRREPPGLTGVLVRVAAPPAELAVACRTALRAAARYGVVLHRLDGDQAPAAYASGPTAVPGNAIVAGSPGSPHSVAGRGDH